MNGDPHSGAFAAVADLTDEQISVLSECVEQALSGRWTVRRYRRRMAGLAGSGRASRADAAAESADDA